MKAVGAELNPDDPELFRREVTALSLHRLAPSSGPTCARRTTTDGWVALLLEDVEGTHPDLGDDADDGRGCSARPTRLVRVLRRAGPGAAPAPDAGRRARRPVGECFGTLGRRCRPAADDPATELLPALGPSRPVRRAAEPRSAPWPSTRPRAWCTGTSATTTCCVRPTGEMVFLDWGAASVGADVGRPAAGAAGAAWTQPWFDAVVADLARHWRTRGRRRGHGVAGRVRHLPGVARGHAVVDVNLPTIERFPDRRESRRASGPHGALVSPRRGLTWIWAAERAAGNFLVACLAPALLAGAPTAPELSNILHTYDEGAVVANIKSQIKRNKQNEKASRAQQGREDRPEVRRAQVPRGRRGRRQGRRGHGRPRRRHASSTRPPPRASSTRTRPRTASRRSPRRPPLSEAHALGAVPSGRRLCVPGAPARSLTRSGGSVGRVSAGRAGR